MDHQYRNINRGTAPKQFFFDGGNMKIKFADRETIYQSLTHGLFEISADDANGEYVFYKNTRDYLCMEVDGEVRHFILGDTARDKLHGTLRQGAGRYVKEYYGVLAVWAICNLYAQHGGNPVPSAPIDFYGMYPPRDRRSKNALIASVEGDWHVHYFNGQRNFVVSIQSVKTFFEPVGGYHARILDHNGIVLTNDEIYNLDVLGVDIGSYTTDVCPADEGGKLDASAATSETIGIFQIMKNIESSILSFYARELDYVSALKYSRLEEAVRTGFLKIGKEAKVPVGEIVAEEAKLLIKPLDALVYSQGGSAAYGGMLFMGGGGGLMFPIMKDTYGHHLLVATATDLPQMQYANVYGLQKMVRLMNNYG